MVTKQEQKPCPVCGKMVSQTGIAGHNKSKFHLDALARRQGQQEPSKVETTTEQVKQEVKQVEELQVKETKPKTTVAPNEPKPKGQDQPGKEYDGLEWD